MDIIYFAEFESSFGQMGVATSEKGICRIMSPEESPFEETLKQNYSCTVLYDPSKLKEPIRQLTEYFFHNRKQFDLKLDINLPPFYKQVLDEVQKIPYGKTASYGEIAARVNNPKAVRAVGTANAKNPIPIIIPCHRVIAGDGSLGGYGGRLDRKMFLLELEGAF